MRKCLLRGCTYPSEGGAAAATVPAGKTELRRSIDEGDPYFEQIRQGWSSALRNGIKAMPDVPW